jgi:hypothetical protein
VIQRFRRIYKFLVPSWLSSDELDGGEGEGGRVLVSLAAIKDAFIERVRQGLEARMPTRAGASANKLTAGDRGIMRGKAETDDQFEARLLAWRLPRTHRVRGNAYEALAQIWHYFRNTSVTTDSCDVRSVDAHGVSFHRFGDGSDTRDDIVGGFEWDPSEDHDVYFSRFWIILRNANDLGIEEQPDFGDAALWGGTLDGTYTIGQTNVTPGDVLNIRSLFQERNWHPGHTSPEWFILGFGVGNFTDGLLSTHLHWSEPVAEGADIVQRAARQRAFRYWSLNPTENNTYTGDPTRFCDLTEMVDTVEGGSSEYGGDATVTTAWDPVTLPNGEVYQGNPARFPIDVLLLDDGAATR